MPPQAPPRLSIIAGRFGSFVYGQTEEIRSSFSEADSSIEEESLPDYESEQEDDPAAAVPATGPCTPPNPSHGRPSSSSSVSPSSSISSDHPSRALVASQLPAYDGRLDDGRSWSFIPPLSSPSRPPPLFGPPLARPPARAPEPELESPSPEPESSPAAPEPESPITRVAITRTRTRPPNPHTTPPLHPRPPTYPLPTSSTFFLTFHSNHSINHSRRPYPTRSRAIPTCRRPRGAVPCAEPAGETAAKEAVKAATKKETPLYVQDCADGEGV